MTASAAPGRIAIRVYYEDTDFSGNVYHASYLRFLERGRTELLRARGIDQSTLFSDAAAASYFVVRAMRIDYLKPARMDDELCVETAIAAVGGASLQMLQKITRGGVVLIEADVKVAFVQAGKPQRLPLALAAKLKTQAP